MSDGFQRVLDHIRSIAGTEAEKGRLFERLMKAYFRQDPLYGDRFSGVWLWSEWRQRRPESGPDIGIDLVAEERDGGYCAIQCKCHAPGTRTTKKALDSFISASARAPFTARIVVDTGDGWGPNAIRTLTGLEPECHVLRFGDLASRPFDWPDLVREEPEALSLRRASRSCPSRSSSAIRRGRSASEAPRTTTRTWTIPSSSGGWLRPTRLAPPRRSRTASTTPARVPSHHAMDTISGVLPGVPPAPRPAPRRPAVPRLPPRLAPRRCGVRCAPRRS